MYVDRASGIDSALYGGLPYQWTYEGYARRASSMIASGCTTVSGIAEEDADAWTSPTAAAKGTHLSAHPRLRHYPLRRDQSEGRTGRAWVYTLTHAHESPVLGEDSPG